MQLVRIHLVAHLLELLNFIVLGVLLPFALQLRDNSLSQPFVSTYVDFPDNVDGRLGPVLREGGARVFKLDLQVLLEALVEKHFEALGRQQTGLLALDAMLYLRDGALFAKLLEKVDGVHQLFVLYGFF